ncbi:hypothetical protein CRUP_038231, partial [Coryphaenoides rupestris]
SYEHSGEIELARLNSTSVKSFVLYASYELGDCSNIDVMMMTMTMMMTMMTVLITKALFVPIVISASTVTTVISVLVKKETSLSTVMTARTVADVFDDDKK